MECIGRVVLVPLAVVMLMLPGQGSQHCKRSVDRRQVPRTCRRGNRRVPAGGYYCSPVMVVGDKRRSAHREARRRFRTAQISPFHQGEPMLLAIVSAVLRMASPRASSVLGMH